MTSAGFRISTWEELGSSHLVGRWSVRETEYLI